MDRYEVMAGKMAPLTDGAHRKWGFTGKVEVVEPCKLLSIGSQGNVRRRGFGALSTGLQL